MKLGRPLSPHLTIYRFPLPSMLSITHRFTGELSIFFKNLLYNFSFETYRFGFVWIHDWTERRGIITSKTDNNVYRCDSNQQSNVNAGQVLHCFTVHLSLFQWNSTLDLGFRQVFDPERGLLYWLHYACSVDGGSIIFNNYVNEN